MKSRVSRGAGLHYDGYGTMVRIGLLSGLSTPATVVLICSVQLKGMSVAGTRVCVQIEPGPGVVKPAGVTTTLSPALHTNDVPEVSTPSARTNTS